MATPPTAESTFHTILGRALSDIEYRNRLIGENRSVREQALKEALGGKEPTEAQTKALDKAVEHVLAFEEAFGGIKPCS